MGRFDALPEHSGPRGVIRPASQIQALGYRVSKVLDSSERQLTGPGSRGPGPTGPPPAEPGDAGAAKLFGLEPLPAPSRWIMNAPRFPSFNLSPRPVRPRPVRLRVAAPALGLVGLCILALVAAGCSTTAPAPTFDSADYLRRQIDPRVGLQASDIPLPFELSPDLQAQADIRLKPSGSDRDRATRVVDYIFHDLGLEYAIAPTRDANGTFRSRAGNCLSFVNLFVALARRLRLSPFYVEVEDYQRWDHRQGMVISQGHIVAGLYLGGDLKTYDFMPYRVKSYRDFEPIDDLTATAHYYNNLGAEALLDGRLEEADRYLGIAGRIDPKFIKGANNLGVLKARQGHFEEAIALYQGALEIDPQNVPLLTNLARAYQQTGRAEEAAKILDSVEGVHHNNPFFYVYRADLAMSRGDHTKALDFLREALAIESEAPEVHVGLARTYVALGEIERAKHHLQRALRLEPSHPEARKLAALLMPALQAPPPTGGR